MNDKAIKAVPKRPAKPKALTLVNEPVHPANMITALMNQPDLDLDKVQKMFELQERFEANVAKKAFNQAMSHFKSICPQITYDEKVDYTSKKTGQRTNYGFASLAGTLAKIQNACAECELNITWKQANVENGIEVTCFLTHSLGHSESTSISAAPDESGGKNSIQAVRSTWSYLRRMTAESLLGLATKADDKDDGKLGDKVDVDVVISAADLKILTMLMAETKTDGPKFLKHFNIEQLTDLPKIRMAAATAILNKKKSQQETKDAKS